MSEIAVKIRARLVASVRCTMLLLLEATAESLHFSLVATYRDPGALDEARAHLRRLAELERGLDQLGWRSGSKSEDVRIEAAPDVLHDAILGSLLDVGEAMARDLHDGPRDTRRLAEDVIALDTLLKRIAEERCPT